MPFYKRDVNEILSAPNFVKGPEFELLAEQRADYTYPVDGWYWFDTFDQAVSFFGSQTVDQDERITMADARIVLIRHGYYETVCAAIATLSLEAQVEWEFENFVKRSSNLVIQMQSLLGLTDQEMNALFAEAKMRAQGVSQ